MKRILYSIALIFAMLPSQITLADKVRLYTYFQENAAPRYMLVDGQTRGIAVDIIQQLNVLLQAYDIVIINRSVSNIPMKRILHSMQHNEQIDLFVGAAKTVERIQKGVRYSIPLYPLRGTFAKRAQNPFIFKNITSLNNMTVGVLRGSRSVQTMSSIAGVRIEKTNTMQQSLQKLASGRIDLVYYHELGLAWQIKNSPLKEQLTLINEHQYIETAPHYIIYASRTPSHIIDTINTIIKQMQVNGSLDKILNNYH